MEVAALGILSGIRASIKKKFKKLNALSESTAVTLEELKLGKREISMFERLLKRRQIKKTAWWEMHLEDYRIDIYSFSGLDLNGMEFAGEGNIQSIVNPDWTAAIDYTGTVITTVSGAIDEPIGIGVGLAIKGVAAVIKFTQGQSLPQYVETVSEYHHRQVKGTSAIVTGISDSKSSAVFFKLNPNEHFRCGLTKVVLSGTLVADACFWNPPGLIAHNPFPMADIEVSTYIPWFIW